MDSSRQLRRARTAQHPDWQHHDAADHPEHAVNRDTHDAERQQQEPHDRVEDQRQQRQRPADHEQEAPEKKSSHTWEYECR